MQRLLTVNSGARTHADWHQTVIDSVDRRRPDWPLHEDCGRCPLVARSRSSLSAL